MKTNIKKHNLYHSIHHCKWLILSFCFFAMMNTGCSNEDANSPISPNEEETGTVNVPITIALGGYGEDEDSTENTTSPNNTRSAPPGAGTSTPSGSNTSDDNGYEETKSINTIRIITFKRKAVEDNGTGTTTQRANDEDFVYDPKNDITLTELTDESGHTDDYLSGSSHKHRVAKGTFSKSYGYEYRIVALAYDSKEMMPYPEYSPYFNLIDNYMKLNLGTGTSFKDFSATFESATLDGKNDKKGNWGSYLTGGHKLTHNTKYISNELISIPQLFYGHVYVKGDETKNPIITYYYDSNDEQINNAPLTGILYRGMAEVVVNIKTEKVQTVNPRWYCLLADNILTSVKLTQYDDFKKGYNYLSEGKYSAFAYHTTPNLGETITLKGYLLPGKTRLGVRIALNDIPYAVNGQFTTVDVSSSDNATGVITVDVVNNVFYLRRNHKYVLTCNDQGAVLKHDIQ